jgi:hypothetical protein
MAEAQAESALHQAPDAQHRRVGWWPDNSTVLRAVLLVVGLVIGAAWLLTLFNR